MRIKECERVTKRGVESEREKVGEIKKVKERERKIESGRKRKKTWKERGRDGERDIGRKRGSAGKWQT